MAIDQGSLSALLRDAIVAGCITALAWHQPGESTLAIAAGILCSIAGANASARGNRAASQTTVATMNAIATSMRPPGNE